MDEAIKIINDGEKPLAFYVFTESKATFEYINRRTSAGGVVRNDVHMHYARELGEGGGGGGGITDVYMWGGKGEGVMAFMSGEGGNGVWITGSHGVIII